VPAKAFRLIKDAQYSSSSPTVIFAPYDVFALLVLLIEAPSRPTESHINRSAGFAAKIASSATKTSKNNAYHIF